MVKLDMVKLDFFVKSNSKDHEEIKKLVKTFDKEKCSYRIHTVHPSSIEGIGLPILKVTLENGEVREYNKETMFEIILNVAKLNLS